MRDNLIKFIKQWEGCRLSRYNDIGGLGTIGIGHLILPNENYTVITEQQAEDILWHDLQRTLVGVKRLIRYKLNENQLIAIADFTFNCGIALLQRSTLRAKINRGELFNLTDEFLKYSHVHSKVIPGLYKRRLAEAKLFNL